MHLGPDPGRRRAAGAAALLLGLAGVVAWPARADEPFTPGSGGALTISADPAQLVLGRDAGADLRIWAPPEVEELSLTASVGKIEGVRRLPGGGFAARYRPPAERYPQVAILAAMGRSGAGALDGWLTVPLAGQGDARVPGEPGSEVSLRIGGQSFGPGRVGEDGIALIPVVVPPGVREGHRGFAPVDLHVPDTSQVHVAADRAAVQADRTEAVRVLVCVVAPHGAARKGDPPVVEVTRGTLTLQPREPGAYVGTWTLPPGSAGEERATVRLEGFPASRAVLRVAVLPGPAASVALNLDRTSLAAGAADEVQITASAVDGSGNPTGSLLLSADAGSLAQEEAGPGVVRGRLRIDPRFGGRAQVLVTARVPSSGATAAQAVALVPGPAARAVLTPRRTTLRADGRSEAVLGLELWDAFQNPVSGSPRVVVNAGSTTLEPRGTGRWAVHYRTRAVSGTTEARVVAELGGARDEAHLLLVPPASSQLSLLAAGGGLAGVSSSISGGQLLAGVELSFPQWMALPADRALGLRLELAGVQGKRWAGSGHQIQSGATVLAGPVLKGVLPRARWFASGTVGFVVGTARGPAGSSRGGVGLAARLGLGLAVPVQRTAPFLELGFLGTGGPGGAVRALTLSLGVRFDASSLDASSGRESASGD